MKVRSIPISPSLRIGCAIFAFSFLLFFVGANFPPTLYWDEKVYVPAARQLLLTGINENWSHPLGGKLLIALGVLIGGDTPTGWRMMSALFGAASVAATYRLGWALFSSGAAAVQCALLCLFNQMLFVQARIAMLDIFMVGFMTWGIAWFGAAWLDPKQGARAQRRYLLSAVCLGWSAGCKWFGFVPGLVCGALYLGAELRRRRGHPKQILLGIGVCLGVAFFGYALVALPYLGLRPPPYAPAVKSTDQVYTWSALISMNWEMLRAQWQHVFPEHAFQSPWYTWIVPYKPVWYFHRIEAAAEGWGSLQRAIINLGNPLVFVAGFVALLECLRRAVWHRDRRAILLASLYFVMATFWGVTGRSWTFNFYYLPASMLLAPGLVYCFECLGWLNSRRLLIFHVVVVGLFIYFYPVLSAQKLTPSEFDHRIWFEQWDPPHAAE